jgi:hypothetical protein
MCVGSDALSPDETNNVSGYMLMDNIQLFVGGVWRPGASGRSLDVFDPATGAAISQVAVADEEDLEAALSAAAAGFSKWRTVPSFQRYKRSCQTNENSHQIAGIA